MKDTYKSPRKIGTPRKTATGSDRKKPDSTQSPGEVIYSSSAKRDKKQSSNKKAGTTSAGAKSYSKNASSGKKLEKKKEVNGTSPGKGLGSSSRKDHAKPPTSSGKKPEISKKGNSQSPDEVLYSFSAKVAQNTKQNVSARYTVKNLGEIFAGISLPHEKPIGPDGSADEEVSFNLTPSNASGKSEIRNTMGDSPTSEADNEPTVTQFDPFQEQVGIESTSPIQKKMKDFAANRADDYRELKEFIVHLEKIYINDTNLNLQTHLQLLNHRASFSSEFSELV